MVIGFKKQFKEPILLEEKVHTIRDDKNDRWHAGKIMHMATGVRTKYYDCFKQDTCKATQRIEMSYYSDDDFTIRVDGKKLTKSAIAIMIKNDGFKTQADFVKWFFSDTCNYKGKLIHWTYLKY